MHSWLRNIRFSFVILFHLCLAYAHFSVGCYSKSNYCCYCSLLPCIVLFFLLFSPFVWFYAYSKSITVPSTMVYRITLAMPFLNLANIINVWLFKTKQHPQQQHQPMRKKEQYRRAHGERRNRDQTEPNNSPRLCNNYTHGESIIFSSIWYAFLVSTVFFLSRLFCVHLLYCSW